MFAVLQDAVLRTLRSGRAWLLRVLRRKRDRRSEVMVKPKEFTATIPIFTRLAANEPCGCYHSPNWDTMHLCELHDNDPVAFTRWQVMRHLHLEMFEHEQKHKPSVLPLIVLRPPKMPAYVDEDLKRLERHWMGVKDEDRN